VGVLCFIRAFREDKMAKAIQGSFKALLNKQPPGPASIVVTGDVEVNSGGWEGALVKAVPQGINPAALILDLKMTPPSGSVTQAFTKVGVAFEERPALHDYTDVTIRVGDGHFTIRVQVVH
jgi:hypothetical protein